MSRGPFASKNLLNFCFSPFINKRSAQTLYSGGLVAQLASGGGGGGGAGVKKEIWRDKEEGRERISLVFRSDIIHIFPRERRRGRKIQTQIQS